MRLARIDTDGHPSRSSRGVDEYRGRGYLDLDNNSSQFLAAIGNRRYVIPSHHMVASAEAGKIQSNHIN